MNSPFRIGLLAILISFPALARDKDEKPNRRAPSSTAAVGKVSADHLNRVRYRLYPGGGDEKDLRVQASLPIPTRYPDGAPGAANSTQGAPSDD